MEFQIGQDREEYSEPVRTASASWTRASMPRMEGGAAGFSG